MFSAAVQRKFAPSAWFYLQNYNIQLDKVTASGPRGHLTKADLVNFINQNKLQKINQLEQTPQTMPQVVDKKQPVQQTQPKKAPAPPTTTKKKDASPAYDSNKPFQQTWTDQDVVGEALHASLDIENAKKYIAHTYLSTKIDTNNLYSAYGDVDLNTFLTKAVKKAFKVVNKDQHCDINGQTEGSAVSLSHVEAS